MEIVMKDNKLREIIEEALIDILTQKPELFRQVFVDAIEDMGLAAAIKEGRKNEFVPEKEICSKLEDMKISIA